MPEGFFVGNREHYVVSSSKAVSFSGGRDVWKKRVLAWSGDLVDERMNDRLSSSREKKEPGSGRELRGKVEPVDSLV